MTNLSSAAQAVLDAYGDFEPANVDAMAAALRVAANQDPYGLNTGEYDEGWGEAMATVIAIATELEGQ